jgi:hypothetical protein
MKKFASLILMLSISLLSGNVFAKERKGADVIIQRVDGIRVKGELIAVKQESILLLTKDLGIDMTIDLRDIRVIKIVRGSYALAGGIIGLIIGGVIGYHIGYRYLEDDFLFGSYKSLTGVFGAAIGGVLCAFIGTGIGFAVRVDETIQIEGKSDAAIQAIMKNLRKKARIPDYQ